MVPLPHYMTIKRQEFDGPTYKGVNVVATGVACLFSPKSSAAMASGFGPIENLNDIVFVDPTADVQLNDLLINESTNETWIISEPPRLYQNPITWVSDHWECTLISYHGATSDT